MWFLILFYIILSMWYSLSLIVAYITRHMGRVASNSPGWSKNPRCFELAEKVATQGRFDPVRGSSFFCDFVLFSWELWQEVVWSYSPKPEANPAAENWADVDWVWERYWCIPQYFFHYGNVFFCWLPDMHKALGNNCILSIMLRCTVCMTLLAKFELSTLGQWLFVLCFLACCHQMKPPRSLKAHSGSSLSQRLSSVLRYGLACQKLGSWLLF